VEGIKERIPDSFRIDSPAVPSLSIGAIAAVSLGAAFVAFKVSSLVATAVSIGVGLTVGVGIYQWLNRIEQDES